MIAKVPKKMVPVNFSCAVFSLLFIHNDLAMWGLVWLHVDGFRVIQFGVIWLDASYINLR
jgi:hypothetical protein